MTSIIDKATSSAMWIVTQKGEPCGVPLPSFRTKRKKKSRKRKTQLWGPLNFQTQHKSSSHFWIIRFHPGWVPLWYPWPNNVKHWGPCLDCKLKDISDFLRKVQLTLAKALHPIERNLITWGKISDKIYIYSTLPKPHNEGIQTDFPITLQKAAHQSTLVSPTLCACQLGFL